MKNKVLILSLIISQGAFAYCTPDNDTCFECGTNCIAELTYSKNESGDDVGTFTVYGTGENGNGSMKAYGSTGSEPNRTTTAPWKDKLQDINNIVVSDGIENIGNHAFTGGKNFDHLELPQSVQTIGMYAFMDGSLKSVNTLKYVDTIGFGAFYRNSLSEVELSDNLERIENVVFSCNKMREVNIPDSVEYIGHRALSHLHDTKVYCNDEPAGRCESLFFGEIDTGLERKKLIKYTIEDGKYVIGHKSYASIEDMNKGNYIKKRIYTIEEANRVAGAKNRVSIRYR